MVGLGDMETESSDKLPKCRWLLLYRGEWCGPSPHPPFLIQTILTLLRLGSGTPVSNFFLLGVQKGLSCLPDFQDTEEHREGKAIISLCSSAFPQCLQNCQLIFQYLLIPKRRTPWNWGSLGSSTLSSEAVLMRK